MPAANDGSSINPQWDQSAYGSGGSGSAGGPPAGEYFFFWVVGIFLGLPLLVMIIATMLGKMEPPWYHEPDRPPTTVALYGGLPITEMGPQFVLECTATGAWSTPTVQPSRPGPTPVDLAGVPATCTAGTGSVVVIATSGKTVELRHVQA